MIYDIIGWIGMIILLIDFMLLSINKISNGKIYQLLNLIASVLIAVGLLPKNAWFSFTLEVIMAFISIVILIKIYIKERKK